MVHAVIAEDDDILLGLLEEIVSMLGWSHDAALNGAEAMTAIEKRKPDLVISDIGMPVMNGIDLLRAIKGTPELARIPVILLSSIDHESEALENGCDAFVAKPYTVDTLLSVLPQVASSSSPD